MDNTQPPKLVQWGARDTLCIIVLLKMFNLNPVMRKQADKPK